MPSRASAWMLARGRLRAACAVLSGGRPGRVPGAWPARTFGRSRYKSSLHDRCQCIPVHPAAPFIHPSCLLTASLLTAMARLAASFALAAALLAACAIGGASANDSTGWVVDGFEVVSNVTGYLYMSWDACDIRALATAAPPLNLTAIDDIYRNGLNSVRCAGHGNSRCARGRGRDEVVGAFQICSRCQPCMRMQPMHRTEAAAKAVEACCPTDPNATPITPQASRPSPQPCQLGSHTLGQPCYTNGTHCIEHKHSTGIVHPTHPQLPHCCAPPRPQPAPILPLVCPHSGPYPLPSCPSTR